MRIVIMVTSVIVFLAMVIFAKTLFIPPRLTIPASVQQLKSRLKAQLRTEHAGHQIVSIPSWLKFGRERRIGKAVGAKKRRNEALIGESKPGGVPEREVRLGFFEGWDPVSLDSLKANADRLTHVSPDWMSIVDGTGRLKIGSDQAVIDIVRDHGLALLPLLTNMGQNGIWIPEAVEGVINGPKSRQDAFVSALAGQLKEMGAAGVIIDWEQVDPSYKKEMATLLNKLASALHESTLELWLCLPMGNELEVYDLDVLAPHVDRFVALLHDENGETDPPGPIASIQWVSGWLDTLVEEYGSPSQWVISLGAYGYDWTDGDQEATTITFQDAMSRAGRASLSGCEFDPETYNPHFEYEDQGANHTVWFLDAVTFLNQITLVRNHQAGGVAIYRLGTEDQGIWEALRIDTASPLSSQKLASLAVITPGSAIAHIGSGNVITMSDEKADGTRALSIDTKAKPEPLVREEYTRFPSYLTIVHQETHRPDAVSITFDDGPDEKWTPQILDILKEKGTKATFFMVGNNMERFPDLVERIVREGHMVGVHTYTHPNVALISKERALLELNATQRLIETITGRSTILFRPPYNADTNPHEPDELIPIRLAQQAGYVTVTEDIDPEDWSLPGVTAMLNKVKEGRQRGGTIVLLHDAGGDRSQTVAALPMIIDYLRARGDSILPLPELIGVPAEQLMPVVPPGKRDVASAVSGWGFKVIHTLEDFFWAFMLVSTALVVLRTLIIAILAVTSTWRKDLQIGELDCPVPVSVLIAAYNEAKVIRGTLQAILATNYPAELDVVVVDDGSQDETAEIVAAMAAADNRIRLVRQANRGKAAALKNGFSVVRHEVVVTLDADTQFEAQTVGELVRPFADPTVGAVSGRARVGNPKTLVARFQSLEYTCGFNLDRRAYHSLNCITVVPGAVSAYRKSAVMAAGGISDDTLAEDTDLTLCLHRCGFRICYAPYASAWTEAPETISAFYKQRFRWAFGTLQCLWKHRDMLFNPRYRALAWFSLPSAWFFNIFLVAIGPIIDGILVVSLILSPANVILYWYVAVFLAADLLLAGAACLIEREPLLQAFWVVPMRALYRPVLSLAVLKSIIKAVKGGWVGWGKLDRTASVTIGLRK